MRYVILNGAAVKSRSELYDALERYMDMPDYFGRNLDALHDVLLHEILPAGPLTFEIENFDALRAGIGEYAVGLRHMLKDTAREDDRLTVVLR